MEVDRKQGNSLDLPRFVQMMEALRNSQHGLIRSNIKTFKAAGSKGTGNRACLHSCTPGRIFPLLAQQPTEAQGCQPTTGLTSTCPQIE